MKDKRQRIAMAWPYAVYTDPTFAATVLQAAAASAHVNGTLPDIAAIANAYQYTAAAAAATPGYFHEYAKFQAHGYNPTPSSSSSTPSPLHMLKKPFVHHHHQNHVHHQNRHLQHQHQHQQHADASTAAESLNRLHNGLQHSTNNFKPSSDAPPADADYQGGTSCKCGIVNCVLTSVDTAANRGASSITPSPTPEHLPPPPVSFFMTSTSPAAATATAKSPDGQSDCSAAVHEQVYHKEYTKNKLFQPYKTDVATKLN